MPVRGRVPSDVYVIPNNDDTVPKMAVDDVIENKNTDVTETEEQNEEGNSHIFLNFLQHHKFGLF